MQSMRHCQLFFSNYFDLFTCRRRFGCSHNCCHFYFSVVVSDQNFEAQKLTHPQSTWIRSYMPCDMLRVCIEKKTKKKEKIKLREAYHHPSLEQRLNWIEKSDTCITSSVCCHNGNAILFVDINILCKPKNKILLWKQNYVGESFRV